MRPTLTALLLCSLLPLTGLAESGPAEPSQPAEEPARPAVEPAKVATAEPRPTAEAPAAVAQPQAEDPVVCKSKPVVGTRFAKKSCMRKSEWQAMTKKAEEDFAAIRNRPVSCPDCRD